MSINDTLIVLIVQLQSNLRVIVLLEYLCSEYNFIFSDTHKILAISRIFGTDAYAMDSDGHTCMLANVLY